MFLDIKMYLILYMNKVIVCYLTVVYFLRFYCTEEAETTLISTSIITLVGNARRRREPNRGVIVTWVRI